jgi:hypothetical protein
MNDLGSGSATEAELEDGEMQPDEALASVERLHRELGYRRCDDSPFRGEDFAPVRRTVVTVRDYGTSRWMADF